MRKDALSVVLLFLYLFLQNVFREEEGGKVRGEGGGEEWSGGRTGLCLIFFEAFCVAISQSLQMFSIVRFIDLDWRLNVFQHNTNKKGR